MLGDYDPVEETFEDRVDIDEDRLQEWMNDGAKPTQNVESILEKAGAL